MDVRLMYWPAVAMMTLTCIVAVRMFLARIGQIKRERIRLQSIATAREAAEKLTDCGAADNFRNLFELPVLFYLALTVCVQIGLVNPLTVTLAWLFVAARCVHSYIHCTYNRVKHRFYAYVTGFFILAVLWIVVAIGLLR
jgi:hypothetical protein